MNSVARVMLSCKDTPKDIGNGMPLCPRCGNNWQVWRNQRTDKLTCHRAWCHTEIPEPAVPQLTKQLELIPNQGN